MSDARRPPGALQVRGELADTQEALRLARVAIEERDFLIATQQQCEAALAGGCWMCEGWVRCACLSWQAGPPLGGSGIEHTIEHKPAAQSAAYLLCNLWVPSACTRAPCACFSLTQPVALHAPYADHASGLTAQLLAAAADIALLFQRVDEKNALEDGNAALVQVRALSVCVSMCGFVADENAGTAYFAWLQ